MQVEGVRSRVFGCAPHCAPVQVWRISRATNMLPLRLAIPLCSSASSSLLHCKPASRFPGRWTAAAPRSACSAGGKCIPCLRGVPVRARPVWPQSKTAWCYIRQPSHSHCPCRSARTITIQLAKHLHWPSDSVHLAKLDAAALPAWGSGKAARQELSQHLAAMFSHPVSGGQLQFWTVKARSLAPWPCSGRV